jgi:hypothetical protein
MILFLLVGFVPVAPSPARLSACVFCGSVGGSAGALEFRFLRDVGRADFVFGRGDLLGGGGSLLLPGVIVICGGGGRGIFAFPGEILISGRGG